MARTHRQRVLRQLGLRYGDLDAVGRALLDQYVWILARQSLLDNVYAEDPAKHGALAVSFSNTALRAIGRLEKHLAALPKDSPLQKLMKERARA